MKIIHIIAFLVLLLFLISACTMFPSFKQDKPSVGRGLKLSFREGAPPTDKIFVGGGAEFLIFVEIENFGEAIQGSLHLWDNIPGTKMEEHRFDGISIEEATIIRDEKNRNIIKEIRPAKYLVPGMPIEMKYESKDIASGTKLNIFAELEIPDYPVKLNTEICVTREEDVSFGCSNSEVITTSKLSKQAIYVPVTVDRIEKTATPLRENQFFIDLKIVLNNLGGGEIVGQSIERKNTLPVPRVSLASGGEFDCSPKILTFVNNKAEMNCVMKQDLAPQEQGFVSFPLEIEYTFPYKMRIKSGPTPIVILEE